MKKSMLEIKFEALVEFLQLPEPKREYRFHPQRKWRFDFAWPKQKIAVEIEGGVWNYGRHNRSAGFIGDMEKYNAAVLRGWKVLRYCDDNMRQAEKDLIQLLLTKKR